MTFTASERISGPELRDANLTQTDALPTADTSSYNTGMDLDALTFKGIRPTEIELRISHPDLTTTHLPDADTLTFDVVSDTALPIDGSSSVVAAAILVSTGTGAAGANPSFARYRIPSNFPRYIGIKATSAGGTGDISAIDMTTELVF